MVSSGFSGWDFTNIEGWIIEDRRNWYTNPGLCIMWTGFSIKLCSSTISGKTRRRQNWNLHSLAEKIGSVSEFKARRTNHFATRLARLGDLLWKKVFLYERKQLHMKVVKWMGLYFRDEISTEKCCLKICSVSQRMNSEGPVVHNRTLQEHSATVDHNSRQMRWNSGQIMMDTLHGLSLWSAP